MKRLIILFSLLLGITTTLSSQIHDPVKWKTTVERVSDTEYDLVIKASIESGWHLYSQNVPEGGPIPTSFTFKESKKEYELVGKTTEGKGHEVHDPVFEMDIKYFGDEAIFKQRIKVLSKENITVSGFLEFMVCDDTNCLPPTEVEYTFEVGGQKIEVADNKKEDKSFLQTTITKDNSKKNDVIPAKAGISETKSTVSNDLKNQEKKEKNKSLWVLFGLSFLAGFAALLTPCVFPMIPMTVSFFTKQSKSKAQGIRNAIIYGISIVVLYVLLGTVITAIFGADSLNALSTNVWFNIIFFILLVVFAVSFLGAFEITLPSSWGTKIDSQADRGGLIGIFFMALALAIVSFSCTGPIVGTALVAAAAQGGIAPVISMFGFSLGNSLTICVICSFPGMDELLTKIRRMVKHSKSIFRLSGTGTGI